MELRILETYFEYAFAETIRNLASQVPHEVQRRCSNPIGYRASVGRITVSPVKD